MTGSIPKVFEHFDLKDYNTMGVSAKARYFVRITSGDQLPLVLKDIDTDVEKMILGGGSNILFVDDFDGLVMHNEISGRELIMENDDSVVIKFGAGENWHETVKFAVENGYGGIENLALIPGSVGAAPIQNIGAYGVELSSVFVELEAIELETGKMLKFSREECKFGYRDSIFKQLKGRQVMITSVTMMLKKNASPEVSYRALSDYLEERNIDDPDMKDVMDAVIAIRSSKLPDPAELGNTGSFFKNPVISQKEFDALVEQFPDIPFYDVDEGIKIPAAWLIESCGWKGKRKGDAGVHSRQALVLVNHGAASGKDIWDLANEIRESVDKKFGIELSAEVNLI